MFHQTETPVIYSYKIMFSFKKGPGDQLKTVQINTPCYDVDTFNIFLSLRVSLHLSVLECQLQRTIDSRWKFRTLESKPRKLASPRSSNYVGKETCGQQ